MYSDKIFVYPCSGWFNVLSKVRVCTPEQLLEMSHEQANPKNAVVSLKIRENHKILRDVVD